jgi:tetratricopeptide (TPR) repeat protein
MISMRCCLVSWLVLVASTSAHADRTISPAATVELDRGEQLFRDGDYAGAIAAFDAGYALDPQPIFLYDKAQAQRLSGDCRSAIESYRAFLATEPPDREAQLAHKNIANCEAKRVMAPPVVDERPVPEPTAAAFDPAPTVSATEQRAWWHDRVGITLAATSTLALGLGLGFAIAARDAAQGTALALDVDEWSARRAAWRRHRIVAGVATGAGITLVTLAAIRFTVHHRSVRVAAAPGGGAMVAIGGPW